MVRETTLSICNLAPFGRNGYQVKAVIAAGITCIFAMTLEADFEYFRHKKEEGLLWFSMKTNESHILFFERKSKSDICFIDLPS